MKAIEYLKNICRYFVHRGFKDGGITYINLISCDSDKQLLGKTVLIAIDDTTIAKFGKKFADVQYLYDRSIHDSKNRMVNGHCFVRLTMSVPVISSWSSWQLWVGIRVMQRKNCKVLSI